MTLPVRIQVCAVLAYVVSPNDISSYQQDLFMKNLLFTLSPIVWIGFALSVITFGFHLPCVPDDGLDL